MTEFNQPAGHIGKYRRENLEFLIYHRYETQTFLANLLGIPGVAQVTLSDILRRKRPFYDYEVRAIEKKLKIPNGWMDKDGWIGAGWKLIVFYRGLNEKGKEAFNQATSFTEKMIKGAHLKQASDA